MLFFKKLGGSGDARDRLPNQNLDIEIAMKEVAKMVQNRLIDGMVTNVYSFKYYSVAANRNQNTAM